MRKFLSILGAGLLASAVQAQGQSLENPALAFGARQSVSSVSLSPNGSQIAYVAPGEGHGTRLYVADLTAGTTQLATYADGDPLEIEGCEFVS